MYWEGGYSLHIDPNISDVYSSSLEVTSVISCASLVIQQVFHLSVSSLYSFIYLFNRQKCDTNKLMERHS